MWEYLKTHRLPLIVSGMLPLSIAILHLHNVLDAWLYPRADYGIPNTIMWLLLFANLILFLLVLGLIRYSKQDTLTLCRFIMVGSWITIFVKYFSDAGWMLLYTSAQGMSGRVLGALLQGYAGHEKWIYGMLFMFALGAQFLVHKQESQSLDRREKLAGLFVLSFLFSLALLILPVVGSLYLFGAPSVNAFNDLSTGFKWQVNSIASISILALLALAIREKNQGTVKLPHLIRFIQFNAAATAVFIAFQMLSNIFPWLYLSGFSGMDKLSMAFAHVKSDGFALIPTLIALMVLAIMRKYYKKQPFDETQDVSTTSGNFGTAAWMTEKELFEKGCYDSNTGPVMGLDSQEKLLYAPLQNTLILGLILIPFSRHAEEEQKV